MRVKDSQGEVWTVRRRFMPWYRIVQPLNTAMGEYTRYRVAPPDAQHANRVEKLKQRRENRKAERARKRERTIRGWEWLYLVPYLILAVVVLGVVGQIVEAAVFIAGLVVWLVLLPFWLVELGIRLVIALGLWLARVAGLARTRVDVVGGTVVIASLTVILVPGWRNAGHLVRALAGSRTSASLPFDPVRDPAAAHVLSSTRAEVKVHESALNSQKVASR